LSKAESVIQVVNEKNQDVLLNSPPKRVEKLLRGRVRFHKTKAKRIVKARKVICKLDKLPKDGFKARKFLVDNVNGLGMKEASHFLRNIGYTNLAIIDGHILNSMKEHGIIQTGQRPSNAKKYLEYEKQFFGFANKLGISPDELDVLLWSRKTGKILK
jgi:N-glycosylase/DNA lyase